MRISTAIQQISSGYRIRRASDDAAGLSIAQKMQSITRGLDQGQRNTYNSQNALRTAEGGMAAITENLQRMRELSLQASSPIMSHADRQMIQHEVDQLKEGISDVVANTSFNTQPLLDGSFQSHQTASQADGSGMELNIQSLSLEALGLEDFDVTQSFDISAIDQALSTVQSARSEIGATDNRMSSTIRSQSIQRENITAARSRIEDADIQQMFIQLSQQSIVQTYQTHIQQYQQQHMGIFLNLML